MSKFDKITKRNEFFADRDSELDALIDKNTGKIQADLVEKINCPLCDCSSYKAIFIKNGFDFVRCDKCTFVYVNPRMREKEVVKFYNSEAPSNARALDFLSSPKQQEIDKEMYIELLNKIKNKVPQGKILDVGSSFGLFLKTAKDLGYKVHGLELNEAAANYGKEKYGITIEPKLLEDCDFNDNTFDIVTMFGVIEHLFNPVEIVKEARRILKPGGLFIGRCPNVQGFVYMVLHELGRTFTGRVHLSYFSEKTLKYLFNKVGFRNVELETFITGKDSLLNYFQFLDPFGDEKYEYLPEKFRKYILDENNFKALEKKMYKLGLGMKFKFIAQK
ncbi:class I SAM-dependent methyltransferase [Candidatus Parcubacteria bacterium]|nr:class I SAM-dependent methyltransferase [Candidatus Parcubacteria bacterium]